MHKCRQNGKHNSTMFVFNTHTLKGSKGEVMVQFRVQILTNFTYHVGCKPISIGHDESHLLIKGAKNRITVIMDHNSHFIWSSQLLPTSPLIRVSVGRSSSVLTSSRECGKFVFPVILRSSWKHINTPDVISFYHGGCSLGAKKATRELL